MKKRKDEAMVKRGSLGEQKGVREDQEEKRIGRAGHLFLLSTVPFPFPLHFFPEHRSLLSSTVFVLRSFPMFVLILSPLSLFSCPFHEPFLLCSFCHYVGG